LEFKNLCFILINMNSIKTGFKKEMPAGVTIKSVLDNYISATGGESGESRKTIAMVGSTVIPRVITFDFTQKSGMQKAPNVEIAMGTMSIMKQVVNENQRLRAATRTTKRF
jgi:hypothetical protein